MPVGADIADVEPEDMLRPYVIIDVRDAAATQKTLPVDTEMLRAWEQAHGRIPGGSLVFLLTGHEKRAGDTDIEHPGFTADAAEFLRAERDIAGVGTDSLSPDISGAIAFPVHKRLLGDECLILENLRNLASLPVTGAHVLLGIMPINEGSGAPTRAIAVIDGESQGDFEVLDLTHEFNKKMPYLSGRDPLYSDLDIPIFDSLNMFDTKLSIMPKAVPIDRETTAKPLYHGYYNGYFSMGVTTGTHLTFPSADLPQGADASTFALDRLIAEVVVVDMNDVADNETLSRDGLFARIQEPDLHGKAIVLLTGRDGHGGRRGRLPPGISVEAATELMERGVVGIATDAVAIDALAQEGHPAERAVHQGGGFTASCLHDPERLSRSGSIVAFLPMPIKGSGAAPARVLGYRPVR
jgi:kynurenine formamidase